MFSCRLTSQDAEYLNEFLALADTECVKQADRFRHLLRELHSRLYRNEFGSLRLRRAKYEVDEDEARRILGSLHL